MNQIQLELNIPSPLDEVRLSFDGGRTIFIKRDDLIHPLVSGNKWRKLRDAIIYCKDNDYSSLTSFGGAFSNHLVATAVACFYNKIPSKAFVRTDRIDKNNPTLNICANYGMDLTAMSRERYAVKDTESITAGILRDYPETFILPEGGSSKHAISGLKAIAEEMKLNAGDKLFYSLGTGTTAAGLLAAYPNNQHHIFPAIKGFTADSLKKVTFELNGEHNFNSEIHYHPNSKSYAKKDLELFRFCDSFLKNYGVLLDPIYTGKAMKGLLEIVNTQPLDSKIIFIHTGGIQAWNGYFYRWPSLAKEIPHVHSYMSEIFNESIL